MQQPEIFALGDVVFDAVQFEVPEDLDLAKTTLGGTMEIPQTDGTPAVRASQTLGVVCDRIEFDATLLGLNAEQKAQTLEAMQLQQQVYSFQRAARSYDVTIFAITLKYHSSNEILYHIELEPIAETTAGIASSWPSANSQVSDSEQAIASLIDTAPADPNLGPAIESADGVLQDLADMDLSLGGLTGAAVQSSGILLTILAAIDLFQAVVNDYAGATDVTSVTSYLFAKQMIGSLSILSAALGSFTGSKAPMFETNGMDLYTIATRYTGDIRNADAIAAVNGISDPFNPPAQIQLPSF